MGDQPELGLAAVRQMVTAGVDIVVHMGRVRHADGVHRFVADISRLQGLAENGQYRLTQLYSGWEAQPVDPITEAWKTL